MPARVLLFAATRAQADRQLYRQAIRDLLENQAGLSIIEQAVEDLMVQGDRVTGVVTGLGLKFFATTVVLTVGTFLGGRILIGDTEKAGGRAGDPPSIKLADRLARNAVSCCAPEKRARRRDSMATH